MIFLTPQRFCSEGVNSKVCLLSQFFLQRVQTIAQGHSLQSQVACGWRMRRWLVSCEGYCFAETDFIVVHETEDLTYNMKDSVCTEAKYKWLLLHLHRYCIYPWVEWWDSRELKNRCENFISLKKYKCVRKGSTGESLLENKLGFVIITIMI